MTKLLLSLHVLAAIVAVGPVTVAASMFPAAARRNDAAALRTLHRICRVYAAFGVVVPVFGLATATSLGVLTDAWLLVSIVLTAAAAAVLGLAVLPGQAAVLAGRAAVLAGQAPQATALAGDQAPRVTAGNQAPPATAGTTAPQATTGTTAPQATTGTTAPQATVPTGATATQVATPAGVRAAARLGMVTGIFNLLWATVVVLMIVRPGSTTGA